MTRRKRKRIQVFHRSTKIAAHPGALVVKENSLPTTVSVMVYGEHEITEETGLQDLARLQELRGTGTVMWVNVIGLGTLETLTKLGDIFDLHRLALEDCLNIPQRPKFDDYGDNQFIVARMPIADRHLETEQLSIFLGKDFVLTLQEKPGDAFENIRERLRDGRPRIRSSGPDYLVYAILDALVDSYFPYLEHIGASLEELDEAILQDARNEQLETLHTLKRDLVNLRRYLWRLNELNLALLREENTFFSNKTRIFMRDCYDHSAHALDLVDSYRENSKGLLDLYLSMVGQRTNEVMKVLTIIATIFIPLSFIAGLYGMNFDPSVSRWNMPELGWAFGYPMALGIMVLCAGGLVIYIWKKGWLR